MQQYLDLLDNVLTFGDRVTNRTGIDTISLFGKTMFFDMKDGFPLVTTKKMFYKAIIGELLWMIRGETNIRPLVLEGIDIWNDWPYKNYRQQGGKLLQENFVRRIITDVKFAEKWGDCGPIYGKQWRRWNTGVKSVNITPAKGSNFTQMHIDYQYIDQLDAAISLLIRDPMSRRIIVNSWNVADLDDMTLSYQRVKELGFDMALSVGQHTNDKELSYYAMTPSGFEWELGWNPIVVDETTWEPATHQGISIWGHTPEGQTIVDILERFKTGARSALHREDTVGALAGAGIPDD